MEFIIQVESQIPKFIRQVINNNKAIISGGSLPYILQGMCINDINIYVHIDDTILLIKDLLKLDIKYKNYNFIFNSKSDKIGEINFYTDIYDLNITITKIPPKEYIHRFDLTCCQIWYDGKNIDGLYFSDFLKNISYINSSCVDEINLQDRIFKFHKIGFNIDDLKFIKNEINICSKTMEQCILIDYIVEYITNPYSGKIPWCLKTHGLIPKILRSI